MHLRNKSDLNLKPLMRRQIVGPAKSDFQKAHCAVREKIGFLTTTVPIQLLIRALHTRPRRIVCRPHKSLGSSLEFILFESLFRNPTHGRLANVEAANDLFHAESMGSPISHQ